MTISMLDICINVLLCNILLNYICVFLMSTHFELLAINIDALNNVLLVVPPRSSMPIFA